MIVDVEDVKLHLNLEGVDYEDDLVEAKAKAAQSYLETMLGYAIETRYTEPNVPPALKEAVCQLAAHWYENRESVLIGVNGQTLPMGFDAIVAAHRDYSFGGLA